MDLLKAKRPNPACLGATSIKNWLSLNDACKHWKANWNIWHGMIKVLNQTAGLSFPNIFTKSQRKLIDTVVFFCQWQVQLTWHQRKLLDSVLGYILSRTSSTDLTSLNRNSVQWCQVNALTWYLEGKNASMCACKWAKMEKHKQTNNVLWSCAPDNDSDNHCHFNLGEKMTCVTKAYFLWTAYQVNTPHHAGEKRPELHERNDGQTQKGPYQESQASLREACDSW